MAVLQFAPAQVERGDHHDVGQFGEVVGKALDALQAGNVLRQQAEDLGVMGFAQDVHFAFGIAGVLGEMTVQLGAETCPVGGNFVEARVEHFVEQDRVLGQEVGRPARTADHFGDLGQGLRILLQEGEIGSAPADRGQEVEAALPGGVRGFGGGSRFDQARAEGVESLAILCRQLQVLGALAEAAELFKHGLRLAETQFGEGLQRVVAFALFVPQSGQPMRVFVRVGKDALEMP